MRSSIARVASLLPVLVGFVSAASSPQPLPIQDLAAIENRQAGGTKPECHANCGYTIQEGATNKETCSNTTWTGLLDACLDCALDFDIWKIYGDGVSKAAQKCGLDATPEPAGGSSSSSAAPSGSTPAPPGPSNTGASPTTSTAPTRSPSAVVAPGASPKTKNANVMTVVGGLMLCVSAVLWM